MADHPKSYRIVPPPVWPIADYAPGRTVRGEGVAYIDPAELRRIYDTTRLYNGGKDCPMCQQLGHICRPCRRERYEARYPRPTPWPLIDQVLIVLAFFAVGAAVLIAAFYMGVRGRG